MTLNCISSNFQRISHISEVTTAKRMKKGQYCQRQRCKQMNVFSTLCSLRSFTVDFFARRPSYTHCCRALTLAFLARISCKINHSQRALQKIDRTASQIHPYRPLFPRAPGILSPFSDSREGRGRRLREIASVLCAPTATEARHWRSM